MHQGLQRAIDQYLPRLEITEVPGFHSLKSLASIRQDVVVADPVLSEHTEQLEPSERLISALMMSRSCYDASQWLAAN